MKIIIETIGELTQQPHGGRGAVCHGHTEDGVPILAVVTSIACPPQHRAAFERSFKGCRGASGSLQRARRRTDRRRDWRERLLDLPSAQPEKGSSTA